MLDQQHSEGLYRASEIPHHYGPNVHILADPVSQSLLADLCSEETTQPAINDHVAMLYRQLVMAVINAQFPRVQRGVTTRMRGALEAAGEDVDRARFEASMIDRDTQVVTVDIARAGILPSLTCYELLNRIMNPQQVRQDHLIMSRAVDAADHVVGARISGEKIGGPIDGRVVLFPDPMGATGSSLSTAIRYYKDTFGGKPSKLITLNLIVTPEFVRRIQDDHPEVIVYALRLDRGMSSPEVLKTVPGTHWDQERGLDSHDYIVPGGGGFGEIMNNAWV